MTDNTQATNNQTQPEFMIQRVYVKDISYEAPQTPAIFQADWKPEINLQMQTQFNQLGEGTHEVILKITVTAQNGDKTAFLAEVSQAGIFTIRNFPPEQLSQVIGSMCPAILFPYVRETITDLSVRGTFPPLYLAPVNFDTLYMQHLEQQQKAAQNKSAEDAVSH